MPRSANDPYLPAAPLQELLQRRLREADRQCDLLDILGVNNTALHRVLSQRSVTLRVADNWATKLGVPMALLYPEDY